MNGGGEDTAWIRDTVRRLATSYRNIRLSEHARERSEERGIFLPEILRVLREGKLLPEKTEYNPNYDSWKYTFEAELKDESQVRRIRVGISLEKDSILPDYFIVVVTVVEKRGGQWR